MAPKKAAPAPTSVTPQDSETKHVEDAKADAPESASSKAAGRKVSPHPSTMEMVKEALKELDSRKGVSTQAIRGYIKEKYTTVDETRLKFMVRKALAKGVETGAFVRPANSAPTTTGAQGRFRIAKTKAKEAKAQAKENADPNVQKAAKPKKAKAPKAKGDETSKEPKKSTKKAATDDAKPKTPKQGGTASKVAPAKKPKAKNAAGEGGTEPKPSKAKKPKASKVGVEEPAAAKKGKKTAAKSEEDESGEKGGVTTTKASGKRGKK